MEYRKIFTFCFTCRCKFVFILHRFKSVGNCTFCWCIIPILVIKSFFKVFAFEFLYIIAIQIFIYNFFGFFRFITHLIVIISDISIKVNLNGSNALYQAFLTLTIPDFSLFFDILINSYYDTCQTCYYRTTYNIRLV